MKSFSSLFSRVQTIVFAVLILVDQASKTYAFRAGWEMFLNLGISFGLLDSMPRWLFVALITVVFLLGLHLWRVHLPKAGWSATFFWSGAVSNMFDRLLFGGVRDWLPLPVFNNYNNLADWWIAVGVVLVVLHVVRTDLVRATRQASHQQKKRNQTKK